MENKGLSISLTVVPMEVGTMRMCIHIAPLSMANLVDECTKKRALTVYFSLYILKINLD